MQRMLLIMVLCLAATAMPARCEEGSRVVKLTVSPAKPGAAPMRYPLLPPLRDVKPGNAAVFYERTQSLEWWHANMRKEVYKAIDTLEKPWQPDMAKTYGWFERFGALKELDYAARCESCDFQMLQRMREDGLWLLIPDMQSMRTLGSLNAVRLRVAIHQGEFDKAAHQLQSGLMLARNIGETPMLITYLVGAALANLTLPRMEEWIAQPDAPSLFWSLTSLPQPLIDWRKALEAEIVMFDQVAPEVRHALQEAKPQPIPVETLQKRFKFLEAVGQMRLNYLEAAFVLAQAEPRARAYFLKKDLTDADIDRLPVTQLVLMYMLAEFDRLNGEYLTIQNLPYWQARPYLLRFQKERQELRKGANLHRLPELFIPAYENIFRVRPRLERGFALLRVIEALRLHAGMHGQWPESLEALGELPIPNDPFTGKAFAYRQEGGSAILEAFAPPGLSLSDTGSVRYELTLRKAKSAD